VLLTTAPGHYAMPDNGVPCLPWSRIIGGKKPGRHPWRTGGGTDGTGADL